MKEAGTLSQGKGDTLSPLGLTKKQSSRWQMEAKLDEDEFASKDDAKIWMIDNQKGRRNLTDGWKWELAQAKKSILLDKGRENKGANQHTPERVLSKVDKTHHNTRDELARELGWSTGKVAMADRVLVDNLHGPADDLRIQRMRPKQAEKRHRPIASAYRIR